MKQLGNILQELQGGAEKEDQNARTG